MALFEKQPVFCSNCGKSTMEVVESRRWITCSNECREELDWKSTLSTMGKEYYPKKKELK